MNKHSRVRLNTRAAAMVNVAAMAVALTVASLLSHGSAPAAPTFDVTPSVYQVHLLLSK